MIRWTFYFEEGNVSFEPKNETEDLLINDFVENERSGFLSMGSSVIDIYVNIDKVKCITRQILDDPLPPETKEPTEAIVEAPLQ